MSAAEIVGAVEDVKRVLHNTGGNPLSEEQQLMIAGAMAFRLDHARRQGATSVLEKIGREHTDDQYAESIMRRCYAGVKSLEDALPLLQECRATIGRLLGYRAPLNVTG